MITNATLEKIRQGETAVLELSVAKQFAALCKDDECYVVAEVVADGDFKVRVYGSARPGTQMHNEGQPMGLWHLLNEAEEQQLGLKIYRMQGGGIIVTRSDANRYATVQAVAVAVMRIVGLAKKYPKVNYL